jgi:hypothetical protein
MIAAFNVAGGVLPPGGEPERLSTHASCARNPRQPELTSSDFIASFQSNHDPLQTSGLPLVLRVLEARAHPLTPDRAQPLEIEVFVVEFAG